MTLEVLDGLYAANENDDWRSHTEVALECLRWALQEPEAASGLLRAAGHHAALGRRLVAEDLSADRIQPGHSAGARRVTRLGGVGNAGGKG